MKDTKELTADKAPDGAATDDETGGFVICPKCGDCFYDAAVPIRDTEEPFFRLAEDVIAWADFSLAHLDEHPPTYWIKNLRLVGAKALREVTRGERAAPAAPSSPSDLSARKTEDQQELTKALRAARGWVKSCAEHSPTFYECKDAQRALDEIDAALTSGASAPTAPPSPSEADRLQEIQERAAAPRDPELDAVFNKAIAALTANEALDKENRRLRAALRSAAVALNIAVGYLRGLGRNKEANQVEGWRRDAFEATCVQTCPVCGEDRHEGTCVDAASGEPPAGPSKAVESVTESPAALPEEK